MAIPFIFMIYLGNYRLVARDNVLGRRKSITPGIYNEHGKLQWLMTQSIDKSHIVHAIRLFV